MAEEKKGKKEKLGNCGGCGKPVKKIRRYYRNGKYFCAKRCFKVFLKKAGQEKNAA